MTNDWILDVLADLKAFADTNGLGVLSLQLDETAMVAAAEISSRAIRVQAEAYGDTEHDKPSTGGLGCHQHA
ncbi:MAG: hypothetical protein KUG70_04650 [Rhodobacteraceae bacterium]|nr:hypothetical protein [Paracoccaceae bacterium]